MTACAPRTSPSGWTTTSCSGPGRGRSSPGPRSPPWSRPSWRNTRPCRRSFVAANHRLGRMRPMPQGRSRRSSRHARPDAWPQAPPQGAPHAGDRLSRHHRPRSSAALGPRPPCKRRPPGLPTLLLSGLFGIPCSRFLVHSCALVHACDRAPVHAATILGAQKPCGGAAVRHDWVRHRRNACREHGCGQGPGWRQLAASGGVRRRPAASARRADVPSRCTNRSDSS